MSPRYVLVLAGGQGERFWPWSTPERPKQLLPLARDGRSLLAATIDRALLLVPPANVLVLTSASLAGVVRRDYGASGVRVVGEPMMRNTGPAVGATAAWLLGQGADPAFAVFPADHAIDDRAAFAADLERGFAIAERDRVLVTFGVKPTHAETNFGYIRSGERISERLFRVAQFTEKPDLARATEWVRSGRYLWNAGIFVWRAAVLLDALEAGRPALAGPLRGLARARDEHEFERGLADVFPGLESVSVDYAVLEPAPNAVMLEAAFDWDDLGSWSAWARRQPRDARGNVIFGEGVVLDCDNCVVVGDGGPAAALGLSDMVVVNANGATLACRLAESNQVRRVSERVREGRGR